MNYERTASERAMGIGDNTDYTEDDFAVKVYKHEPTGMYVTASIGRNTVFACWIWSGKTESFSVQKFSEEFRKGL